MNDYIGNESSQNHFQVVIVPDYLDLCLIEAQT